MLSEGYQDGFRDGWSDQRDGRKPSTVPTNDYYGREYRRGYEKALAPTRSALKAAPSAAPLRPAMRWRDVLVQADRHGGMIAPMGFRLASRSLSRRPPQLYLSDARLIHSLHPYVGVLAACRRVRVCDHFPLARLITELVADLELYGEDTNGPWWLGGSILGNGGCTAWPSGASSRVGEA